MKFKKLCIAAVILTGLALGLCPSNTLAENSSITWYSYKDGIGLMKNQNKKGFLHFNSTHCVYCRLMNTTTFSDTRIIDYLNQNFIPILVNAAEEKDLAFKYGVRGVPTSWFLAENSSAIGQRPGFIPPEILLQMLEYINTNSYKSMSFDDYVRKQPAKDKQHP